MKIITMTKIKEDGEPLDKDTDIDPRDWFCVIETLEEKWVYDQFVREISSNIQDERLMRLWNDMVKHAGQSVGLCWGDDDIYTYIMPNEIVPEVGEHYKLDNDEWVRVE